MIKFVISCSIVLAGSLSNCSFRFTGHPPVFRCGLIIVSLFYPVKDSRSSPLHPTQPLLRSMPSTLISMPPPSPGSPAPEPGAPVSFPTGIAFFPHPPLPQSSPFDQCHSVHLRGALVPTLQYYNIVSIETRPVRELKNEYFTGC